MFILGETKNREELRATVLVNKLTSLGMSVNMSKSMKEATQKFTYVGHEFNLQQDKVSPTQAKQIVTQSKCKQQLKGSRFQPKNLAALAGNLVAASKSNVSQHGLLQQIMKWAAWGVNQNAKWYPRWNTEKC